VRAAINTTATTTGPAGVVLGFDIGGTTVKARAFGPGLVALGSAYLPARRGPAIIDAVAEAAGQVLDQLSPDLRAVVGAAGVVVPGLVDPARGVAVRSVNLDLVDLPLADRLSDRLGLPVRLDHDVTAAGVAVHRLDPCGADPCVVVIGTGIAAVSFIDGRLVRGAGGQAGEIGHCIVRPGGRVCACGRRGCLETVASAAAIAQSYTELTGYPVDGAHTVLERISDDPIAAAVWADAVSALADVLLDVRALTAPGEFVLAGGLAEAGRLLTDPLNAQLAAHRGVLPVPPVRVSSLGARAGVLGAGLLALDLVGAS
jgi:glucokinase